MKEHIKNLGKVVMTPKGAWSIEKEYEILDIVYDSITDHAYISKQEVPSGVDLSDSRYWMPLNVSGYSDSNVIALNSFNKDGEIQSYTLEEAIKAIKDVGRKSGAILIFYNDNVNRLDIAAGCWEIWQFNSINVYDWENLDAWINIYYNYNKFVGWYAAENILNKEISNPDVGCYAFVGNIYNEAFVYRCDVKNRWIKTNQKAQHYIKVVFGDNIIIGENGNWWQNGIDTNIPVSVKGDNGLTPYLRWSVNNQIEYSYDNINWYILSDKFNTNIKIKDYVNTIDNLPNNIELGTIYGVGPIYAEDDTEQINPIYNLYVYTSNGWINNGGFNSISAGIVQELGDNETEVMSQDAVTREINNLELKTKLLASYNFINDVFNIPSSNCSLLNGVKSDNTKFNYNGFMYEFEGDGTSVKDCRIILQKLPDDVRLGSKIKIECEVFIEGLPTVNNYNYGVAFSVLTAGGESQQSNTLYNGYSVYKAVDIEVTQSMKDALYHSVDLWFPIQAYAGTCKIYIGRVYIGYDSNGSAFGDYNIYKKIQILQESNDLHSQTINRLKLNNSYNFLTSCTDINSNGTIGLLNAEVLTNTIFNYKGNMIKYSGGNSIKDCRVFLQYLPEDIEIGQKLKIFAEVYIDGTYASFRSIVANKVVGNSIVLWKGYNILEIKDIEVTAELKNTTIGSLGIFTPLQAEEVNVYIGRMYFGIDGEGSLIGDVNLENRLYELEKNNIKEKIEYLSNANSPNIVVSPNGNRFILSISNEGVINTNIISCKKVLYLGNSFVSHVADESKGWTPIEPWGMAAETKEKDFVHQLNNMLKSIVNNVEIAGIINIVPWEGNSGTYDKTQLNYIQNIDFDCVVLRVGENVNEWEDFDKQTIDLLDNYILKGKNNVPVFISSLFSFPGKYNTTADKNRILKNIANYYHTPFSFIGVNNGNKTNIYNAYTTPLPPKYDGTEWDKEDVLSSVLGGHPGNIGHEYIAKQYFEAIKLYYKL